MSARSIRDRSDLIWATWLGSFIASFAVLEAVAFRTSRPTTLCRSLRRWFGIHPRGRRHYVSAVAWLVFWGLFWLHLETLPPLQSGDN